MENNKEKALKASNKSLASKNKSVTKEVTKYRKDTNDLLNQIKYLQNDNELLIKDIADLESKYLLKIDLQSKVNKELAKQLSEAQEREKVGRKVLDDKSEALNKCRAEITEKDSEIQRYEREAAYLGARIDNIRKMKEAYNLERAMLKSKIKKHNSRLFSRKIKL